MSEAAVVVHAAAEVLVVVHVVVVDKVRCCR